MSEWFVHTDCASTTSTSGSMMATRRMVLMSNPYTRSHPDGGGAERGGAERGGVGRGREGEDGRGGIRM